MKPFIYAGIIGNLAPHISFPEDSFLYLLIFGQKQIKKSDLLTK